jgi:hypothetical protein
MLLAKLTSRWSHAPGGRHLPVELAPLVSGKFRAEEDAALSEHQRHPTPGGSTVPSAGSVCFL